MYNRYIMTIFRFRFYKIRSDDNDRFVRGTEYAAYKVDGFSKKTTTTI